jgi:thiol-disulfide isomerase/thioredoxin
MLARLAVLAGVALAVWALSWALRRYAANATTPEQFDAADGASGPVEPSAMLVTFSGPYCLECEEVLPRLQAASAAHDVPLQVIDIKESPHLATKYDVRLTPTTFVVGLDGQVRAGWLGTPPEGAVEQALAAVSGVSV